ncbi:rod shape-determining protein MreC [Mobilitalea sibirica]|uniref:Cell shape-determining protein MreC n=1 Tax=Mobilitalea sibirica TaxID=1462919 RepID=A0A8J7GYW7_9FIRM|nr:rod shape-determining protein MreC [Mobilitalea sibirica]MBH1940869.1 rod shape-determining protein MreC [Mobilitalea sibirica]
MRRRAKIHINPKHILIGSVILCISLIIVSFRFGEQFAPVKSAVGTVVSPMQKGINTVGSFISDKLDTLANINELLEENEKLKEQVHILSYENKLLLQDKYELDGLRKLYELDQKFLDYPKVAARVISKDTNNWYNVFTIDKGTRDGLKVNMNVLAGNGLAGIITEVYYNYSVVRSIIDDNSNVSGMFLKTSDTCIVRGDLKLMDEGKIRVELISKDAVIEDNYEVVTSHISPNFLQGILIGYVSDIKLDSSNMTKTAYLTPVVDFERLEEVLIITELKEPLLKEPLID